MGRLQSPKGDKPNTPTDLEFTAIQSYKIQDTTRKVGEGGRGDRETYREETLTTHLGSG